MSIPFILALPRLHAEFYTLPHGCLTLWPGLPSPLKQSWQPFYPWNSGQAAACLEDFRRAARDGASGTPVLSLGAEPAPADLSPAERAALRELLGVPVKSASLPPRIHAQKILLLTWLQEEQALELAALEERVQDRKRELSSLLSGRASKATNVPLPEDRDLPSWKVPLAAAFTFLPDMPLDAAIFVNSQAMAEALAELGEKEDKLILPGYRALSVSSRALAEAMHAAFPSESLRRTLTFILPK